MLGIVNKAIENFLRDTYGSAWNDVVQALDLDHSTFEPLLGYDHALTGRLLLAAEARTGKSHEALLEDLGIYLVSHPRYAPLRRLLRFAGVTFEDFLLSIDELPDRSRLALPDLELPPIRVFAIGPEEFELCCGPGLPGFAHVLAGCLRAMADDYGALVTLSLRSEGGDGAACIEVTLHAVAHSDGNGFHLAAQSA
jgi:hypothetical protein